MENRILRHAKYVGDVQNSLVGV